MYLLTNKIKDLSDKDPKLWELFPTMQYVLYLMIKAAHTGVHRILSYLPLHSTDSDNYIQTDEDELYVNATHIPVSFSKSTHILEIF